VHDRLLSHRWRGSGTAMLLPTRYNVSVGVISQRAVIGGLHPHRFRMYNECPAKARAGMLMQIVLRENLISNRLHAGNTEQQSYAIPGA
jgi:hypothetical protein